MEPILYGHFERIEEAHWWWRSRRAIVVELLRRQCFQAPPARVLDVGCGMGALLAALPASFEGHGVDSSERAVSACRSQGLRVHQASAQDLPFSTRTFHAVLALDLLEHLSDERTALREFRRVLAPTGILIVTVPAFPALWSRWDSLNRHERRYVKRRLDAVLREAGFEPLLLTYMNFLLFPAVAARTIVERFRAPSDLLPMGADVPPPGVNGLFQTLFSLERHWFARGRTLPWGSSLLAVARPTAETGRPGPRDAGSGKRLLVPRFFRR